MTGVNTEVTNESVATDKSENVVYITTASKSEAEEMEKIKMKLRTKKSWATRIISKLESTAKSFKDAEAKVAIEKTHATKIQLKNKAKDVLENKIKLKEYQKDLEKLVEQLREALDNSPTSGANMEEAVQKLEVDAFEYVDKIDISWKNMMYC